jgi:hypothetical protein
VENRKSKDSAVAISIFRRTSELSGAPLLARPLQRQVGRLLGVTHFLKAGDVLFEMIDALLLSPRLASFPELSCVPVFRRQWPSLYEGLQDGQVDQAKLFETLTEQLPESERLLLVGDHTAWACPQARTLQERSFQHQPTSIKGQKPITIGHGTARWEWSRPQQRLTGRLPAVGSCPCCTSVLRARRRLQKRRPSN